MTDQIRFEAWTLPESGSFTRKLVLGPIAGFQFQVRNSQVGHGTITIPDDFPEKDQLLYIDPTDHSNDEGSLIRAFRGEQVLAEWYALRMSDTFSDEDPVLEVSGETIERALNTMVVLPFDHPRDPMIDPDWIYGAGTILDNPGFEQSQVAPPAPPAWVNVGTYADGIGDVTPGEPAALQTNDILLLHIESPIYDDNPVPAPTGGDWTLADHSQCVAFAGASAAFDTKATVYWHRYDGTTSPNYTVLDTGDHTSAVVTAWRGCVTTGSPIDSVTIDSQHPTPAGTWETDGPTTNQPNTVIVGTMTIGDDFLINLDAANSNLTDFSLFFRDRTTAGFDGGLMVWRGDKLNAGPVGTTSGTYGGTEHAAYVILALKTIDGGHQEIQTVWNDATGGTFTLSLDGGTTDTGNIAWDATAQTVETALATLPQLVEVSVLGSGKSNNPWYIEFVNPADPGATLTADDTLLTGETIGTTIFLQTEGGAGFFGKWTQSLAVETGALHGTYDIFEVSDEQARTGNNSLKIDGGAPLDFQEWPGAQQVVKVSPGRQYRASAWVYSGTAGEEIALVIRDVDEGFIDKVEITTTASAWVELSIPAFVIPDGVTSLIFRVAYVGGDNPAIWYLDDCTLAPGLPAAPLGEIFNDLLDDLNTHLTVGSWLTRSFTDALDSDGVAWDQDLAWAIKRGQTLLQLLTYARRWGYEYRIRWTGTVHALDLFNPDALGTDYTTADTPAIVGRITGSGPLVRRAPDFTWMLAEGNAGTRGIAEDTTLTGAFSKWMGYWANRTARTSEGLTTAAAQRITDAVKQTEGFIVRTDDPATGNLPLEDILIGDTVQTSLPGKQVKNPYRVAALTVSGDADTTPTYEWHLSSQVFTPEAAVAEGVNQLLRTFRGLDTEAPADDGDPVESYSYPTSEPSVAPGFTVRVAASNAGAASKAAADLVCDGTADEVEINQAIDMLGALLGDTVGGRILLSEGTFSISLDGGTGIIFNETNGGIIQGAGRRQTLIENEDTWTPGSVVISVGQSVTVRDLSVIQSAYSGTNWITGIAVDDYGIVENCYINVDGYGIEIYTGVGIQVINNSIEGFGSTETGNYGIKTTSGADNYIAGNEIIACERGIVLAAGSYNSRIIGNTIGWTNSSSYVDIGIQLDGTDHLVVGNTYLGGSGEAIVTALGGSNANLVIADNVIQMDQSTSAQFAIALAVERNVTVANNNITGSFGAANGAGISIVQSGAGGAYLGAQVAVTGNNLWDMNGTGIEIQQIRRFTVTGNTITSHGHASNPAIYIYDNAGDTRNGIVSDNAIGRSDKSSPAAYGYAVGIKCEADHVTIADNNISRINTEGILIHGNGHSISGNSFSNFTSTAVAIRLNGNTYAMAVTGNTGYEVRKFFDYTGSVLKDSISITGNSIYNANGIEYFAILVGNGQAAVTVSDNTIMCNSADPVLSTWIIEVRNALSCKITDNSLFTFDGPGFENGAIWFSGDGGLVSGNLIYGINGPNRPVGIQCVGNHNIVSNNVIYNETSAPATNPHIGIELDGKYVKCFGNILTEWGDVAGGTLVTGTIGITYGGGLGETYEIHDNQITLYDYGIVDSNTESTLPDVLIIRDNLFHWIDAEAIRATITGAGSITNNGGIAIRGNEFHWCGTRNSTYGIYLSAVTTGVINAPLILNNHFANSYPNAAETGQVAIYLAAYIDDALIKGNKIDGATTGIQIAASTCDDNVIVGNDLRASTTAITDSGTGTLFGPGDEEWDQGLTRTDGHLVYWDNTAGTYKLLDPAGADTDAIHDNVSAEISAVTEKTAPVNADLILIEDSAASNAKKRVQLANLPGTFGEIYAAGNTTETTIGTANTYVQVVTFTADGQSNGTTPAHGTDDITIDATGIYLIMLSASISSGTGSGGLYEGEIQKNNGATGLTNVHWDRQLVGGGGDTGSVSASGLASLTATDTVEFWVRCTTATNVLIEDVNLSLYRIG